MASLAEIRARLAAADNKQGNQSSGGDGAIYPHWNMQEGKEPDSIDKEIVRRWVKENYGDDSYNLSREIIIPDDIDENINDTIAPLTKGYTKACRCIPDVFINIRPSSHGTDVDRARA